MGGGQSSEAHQDSEPTQKLPRRRKHATSHPQEEEYHLKFVGFEIDCNEGKGSAAACHHTGEYWASVKNDYSRAADIYRKNCTLNKYMPSCFVLGRMHCKFE